MVLLLTSCPVDAVKKQFVWLADIHADPFYGTSAQCCPNGNPPSATSQNIWGMYGNDPGFDMLRSATAAAVAASSDPAFLLFSGDFTRHDQSDLKDPWENVTSIVKEVTEIMGSAFPDLLAAGRISLGTQGNDDAPRNYWFPFTANQTSNPWASNLGAAFTETGAMNPREAQNYSYGGAFAAEMGGLHIITINTIIYSVMHKPVTPDMGPDPFGQFAWLRAQLEAARARGKPAWIVGHIPPGIETYAYTELWKTEYTKAYLDVVQDPELGPFIAAQLFGHVHACEFRLLPSPAADTGPVLLSGALSPIYNNNPAFRIIEYDSETSRPVGMAVHYAPLTPGKEPLEWTLGVNITEAYLALGDAVARDGFLSQQAYAAFTADLSLGEADWNTYATWYKGAYPNPLWNYGCDTISSNGEDEDMAGVSTYLCSISIDTTLQQFRQCMDNTVPATCASHEDDDAFSPPLNGGDDADDDNDKSTNGVGSAVWVVPVVLGAIAIGFVAHFAGKLRWSLRGVESSNSEQAGEVIAPLHDQLSADPPEEGIDKSISQDSTGSSRSGYARVVGGAERAL